VSIHELIFAVLWLSACGYGAICGGAPERLAAATLFVGALATSLFALAAVHRYQGFMAGVALTDVALLLVLIIIALFSTRFWPMAMASMQGCGTLAHLAKPLGPGIISSAYYATVAFWGFPICVLLLIATRRHQLRVKRYGVDHAWMKDLPRRYREGWSVDELTPRSGKR
jgi:hypothetical protein